MSSKVTVVIPTHNRFSMCQRAHASCLRQRPDVPYIVIANSGEHFEHRDLIVDDRDWRDTHMYDWIDDNDSGPSVLSWYVGAQMASTPYVAILFDDDWYEPTFIERMVSLLDKGCYFAFCQSMIHMPDGRKERNLPLVIEPGTDPEIVTGDSVLAILRRMETTISPACCLFRRETILEYLHVSRIPTLSTSRTLVGPDKLLLLMASYIGGAVGYVDEPLVNLGAHEDSTTIKAKMTEDGARRLHDDYKSVVEYFDLLVRESEKS